MSVQRLIDRLLPLDELRETIRRFPLSVICALILFVISILSIHNIVDFDGEIIGRIVFVVACCYFWFGISKLMSESQEWSTVKHYSVSFIVAVGIASLFALSNVWAMHLIFLMPALLLGIMIAPYIKGGDDLSFWFFNRMMWFGVVISYAALIMFAGGLSAALGAINVLFGVKVYGEIYGDIWSFAALVLGPVYALSWVPKKFEFTQEDCNDPPGLKFIVNWISAPMVFVYLLILYAYFGKIVITGEVPNGYLALLISGFAGAGIVTYLVAWPLREEGSPQLRFFYKIFFPALLIPVCFHFYAIWERVDAYGITEQRYLIIISSIWFMLSALGYSFSKMPIKFIPMILAVLMLFGSFGPWGGVSVSGQSQYARLETLLNKHNLIVDGKAVKATEEIPFDDRLGISSTLDYLCSTNRDELVVPTFGGFEKCKAREMTKSIGIEHVSRYMRNSNYESFTLNSDSNKHPINVDGFSILLPKQNVYLDRNPKKANGKQWQYKNSEDVGVIAYYESGRLYIGFDGHGQISFSVEEFARAEFKKDPTHNRRDLIMESEESGLKVKVVFSRINLRREKGDDQEWDDYGVNNFNFMALIGY